MTNLISPLLCEAVDLTDLEERDEIEERVSNGELCTDGQPHDWKPMREHYGADADGNRGVWLNYKECRKCGEEL